MGMKLRRLYTVLVLLVLVPLQYTVSIAYAADTTGMSAKQRSIMESGSHYYNVDTCIVNDENSEAGSGDTSAPLVGKDNEEKTWNFFKEQRLSDEQTAGIMGNMMQESHFDPEILQVGGRSKNPEDAKDLGWGIIQWSGNGSSGHSTADKFNSLYDASGLKDDKYLLSTQLELVWGHMQNKPPITRGDFSMDDFKKITDEKQATLYFTYHIEAGTDPGGIREQYASQILNKYTGKGDATPSTPSTPEQDSGGTDEVTSCKPAAASQASPECENASGNAQIICEAKKYDTTSYVWGGGHAGGAAYHNACKDIDTSHECGLDCSGLVTVAVYDVYRGNGSWDTHTLASDTHNWKEVQFDQVKPGDVIEPNSEHVEIIDHIDGNTIFTFGAHTENTTQPKQVGPAQYTKADGQRYFTYVGAGT